MTPEAHIAEIQRRAASMLDQHELLSETYWDDGRSACWLIGRPGRSEFRTEILAGVFGSLVVHGDFQLTRFASYSDRADAWSRLRWMADCRDVRYYVRQKARIGEHHIDTDEYDETSAREDIIEYIRELRHEGSLDADVRQQIRVLVDACRHYLESREELRQHLYDEGHRWELYEHDFGMRLGATIIINHAALGVCARLLRERHGAEGPPACRRAA